MDKECGLNISRLKETISVCGLLIFFSFGYFVGLVDYDGEYLNIMRLLLGGSFGGFLVLLYVVKVVKNGE